MPAVINVERKKRTKEWFYVYLSNGDHILSHIDLILKFQVRKGRVLSESEIKEIRETSELIRAKETAYRFLSYKPRTQKEVEEKLRQSGFSEALVKKTVDDIKNLGFINDLEYARNFVFNRLNSRKLGKYALRGALASKGVQIDVIEKVLAEREEEIDEFEIALELAREKIRRLKSSKKKGKQVLKRKIYEFLARRGFEWETISRTINKIFGDEIE